jgi:hypothetical protein
MHFIDSAAALLYLHHMIQMRPIIVALTKRTAISAMRKLAMSGG